MDTKTASTNKVLPKHETQSLLQDIRTLIDEGKQHLAVTVNAAMSMLYWNVGRRINTDVLGNERAEYGKKVVATLAEELEREYGKGWSEKQLRQCMQFASTFPDEQIFYTLCRELSWSHLRLLMSVDDPLKREFYIEMSKLEHWSFRILRERVQSMLYERTAISKQPEETIAHDLRLLKNEQKLSPDVVFRDPYFLDFLGLRGMYSERDLESSALFKKFLLFGVRNFNSALSARRFLLIALCDGGIKIPHSASYKNQANNVVVFWRHCRNLSANWAATLHFWRVKNALRLMPAITLLTCSFFTVV